MIKKRNSFREFRKNNRFAHIPREYVEKDGKEQKQHQKTRNLVPRSQMKDLEEFIARCEANSIPDDKIDTSDCPVLTAEQLSKMRPCHLVNRKLWKPQKKVLSIRLDATFWMRSAKAEKDGKRA